MLRQAQSRTEVWLHPSSYLNGKRKWVVITAPPPPLYLWEAACTDHTGGSFGVGAGLHAHGKFRRHRDLIPLT
jgi:hypothetical protein